jgi:hypothetical protein
MTDRLKRWASEPYLDSSSTSLERPDGSTYCSTLVPGYLCRVDPSRRLLSTSNLCPAEWMEAEEDTFWEDNPYIDLK